MEGQRESRFDPWIRVILGVLIALLLVLLFLLFHEYRQLRREDVFLSARGSWRSALEKHQLGTQTDPDMIESWMTFSYVSAVYGVPTTTLQTALSINDPRFPRVAIEEYAEDDHLNATTVLAQVRSAVSAYLAQKGS